MHAQFIDQLIEKNPQLKSSREKLVAMAPGAYCLNRSWGFGKIREYNASENKLIIDFENNRSGHPMDPAFCVDKLDILDADNILVQYHTNREHINELIEKRPVDLVVNVLSKCPDGAASATELETILSRLMDADRFKRWWNAVKKALAKEPRIACPAKKSDPYVLRDEPIHPDSHLLEEFFETKRPREKIWAAETLLHLAPAMPEVKERLSDVLETLTQTLQTSHQLSNAERLQGIWVHGDIAKSLGNETASSNEADLRNLLENSSNLSDLMQDLPPTSYKRFLETLRNLYPDAWQTKIIQLLRLSAGKSTQECVAFLMEQDQAAVIKEAFTQWLDEQNLRGPVLFWIIKNRASRKYMPVIEGMFGAKLLGAVLYAIDHEALQLTNLKRIALADLLSEDTTLISDMLKDCSLEVAKDIAQSLLLSQGFEPLTKKSLIARFIKLYPSIQSLVAGESQGETERLIVSRESFTIRQKELEELISQKIPDNKRAIAIAREHGDLRENSEYKMARQDQEFLMARKTQLESELARASITDFKDAPSDKIGIGSIVELRAEGSSKIVTQHVMGAWDSNPDKNILSYKTPLGKALLGKHVGDEASTNIDGKKETWTIVSIKAMVVKD
jgi:transcription elongation factor GreA